MAINQFEKFFILRHCLVIISAANRLCGAVPEMVLHQRSGNAPEGLLNGRDLNDNVCTVAFVFHHLVKPANLAFNASQSFQVRLFDFRFDSNSFSL